MDQQRALLDELMGVSRDGEREEIARKFTDEDVCKFYIQGFCFMEEFQRTKHHYGDCTKVHDEACKSQWEQLDDAEKARYPYERELFEWLEKFTSDLRAKVKRNQERISSTADVPLMSSDQTRLAEIDAEVKSLVRESEELGESGDVDAAQLAATKADRLKTERVTYEVEARGRAQDALNRYGEQQVCQFSGVIINNEESRLRDHKSGKNYRTWVHVHEKRKELEETFKRRGSKPSAGGFRSRERDRSQDMDRHRERSRDRERGRDAHRERRRESDRGRERDRDRDSHRPRDRHRSHDQEYSHKRHYRNEIM